MKTFKIGEPIRFGVKDDGGLTKPKASDFKCYYATIINPKDDIEVSGDFIDDDPFYWTPTFEIFAEGKYIVHITNDNDKINVKETFSVSGELYESNDDIEILS